MNKSTYKKFLPAFIFILLFISNIQNLEAQSGQFIQFWGGPQYVGMLNFNDNNTIATTASNGSVTFTGEEITDETYRWGGGIDYINNFTQNYGYQTGIYYSGQGQKYEGYVKDFNNPGDSLLTHYHSQVTMDYIRIPFMFRFNSILDEGDRINISIFMGLQAGYLISITSTTSPETTPEAILEKYKNFNLMQLYNAIDFGLGAGAQFNVRLTEKLSANLGLRFDRSIVSIENHSFVLPDDAPVEYLFPLSTMKSERVSHDDITVRPATQNISVNAYLGLSIKLKNGKPPKPHPTDDLPPE